MEVSLPAFAHRVTVLGSTRNMVATSAGVSSGSASGVRADMCAASPPGPVLRSCGLFCTCAPSGAVVDALIWPTETILPSPDVTSRPPRAKFLSVSACPVGPLISVTVRESSVTFSRNEVDSEKCRCSRLRRDQARSGFNPMPGLISELHAAQGAPSGPQPLIHGNRKLQLAGLKPGDRGGHLSH